MVGVHSEGDMGLAPVASEVSFADEYAQQKALFELVFVLFHRQVSRGTMVGVGCCFTVKFPVKHQIASRA